MEVTGTPIEQDDDAVLVYVAVANQADAMRISREVVSQRLAACANIIPNITSVYWWDGALQEDGETLVLLKTRAILAERLRTAIASLHSYEVPAISVVPLALVHPPYLTWLRQQTQDT